MGLARVFYFGDTGAPRLSGTAGDAAALLDALLVNGYNSQTVTSIARVGSVATVTKTAHGFSSDRVIRHAGWDQAEYNGDFFIFNVTANTYDITVGGTPATPGTTSSSATAKVAPCDWTIAQTSTNLRSYQQGPGSNGFIMGLDDTGTTSCRVRGFESMSAAGVAVASGSGPFPTDVQQSGGYYWRKSGAASTAARYWIAFGDERTFYIISTVGNTSYPDTGGGSAGGVFFGDFASFTPGDIYNTMIFSDTSGSTSWTLSPSMTARIGSTFNTSAPNYGFAARSYLQTGGSVMLNRLYPLAICVSGNTVGAMGGGVTYPAPAAGGLIMCDLLIDESISSGPRGCHRGMYATGHTLPGSNLDIVDGAAGTRYAGKKFMLTFQSSNTCLVFQIGGAW
jgi:hypothetical protein